MSAPQSEYNPNDIDITLSAGDIRLTVSPHGASLRGLSRIVKGGASPIITEYRGAANKVAGQGDVLIPFPGRVKGGAYTFNGRSHQMVQNDAESPSAIHGLLRSVDWAIGGRTDREIAFLTRIEATATSVKGYPYTVDVTVTYRATEDGMTCAFAIRNDGAEPAPVAVGFHPYFTAGSEHIDGDELRVCMDSIIELENFLPTGRVLPVEGTEYDFREARIIGTTALNTCFTGPQRDSDGLVRVMLTAAGGRRVTVWMDEAYDYVVLYSGDPLPPHLRRRSVAIEAMTCGVDAFNHPEWGLKSLQPGETFTGRWGVIAE